MNNVFDGIYVATGWIITDLCFASDIIFADNVINIKSGLIYYSGHYFQSNISISNVSISTEQLLKSSTYSLFTFSTQDTVFMDAVNVSYLYNTSNWCSFNQTISDSIINATCSVFLCKDPVQFIKNRGTTSINNVFIDMDIFYDQYNFNKLHYVKYKYDPSSIFIENAASSTMHITNITIGPTTAIPRFRISCD